MAVGKLRTLRKIDITSCELGDCELLCELGDCEALEEPYADALV